MDEAKNRCWGIFRGDFPFCSRVSSGFFRVTSNHQPRLSPTISKCLSTNNLGFQDISNNLPELKLFYQMSNNLQRDRVGTILEL